MYVYIYIYIYIYISQIIGKRPLKCFQKCAVILCAPHILYPLEHSSLNERAGVRKDGLMVGGSECFDHNN